MGNGGAHPRADGRPKPSRGVAMAGLATAMFLVILDAAMVNLAGPAIREGLTLTAAELTIVVDGYLVAFAGLLLLGGRLADVLGGRNVFLAGTAKLPIAIMIIVGSAVAPPLAKRIGPARALPVALAVLLAGFVWLALDRTAGGFSLTLLGAFVLIGAAGAGEDIAFTTAFLGQAALILIALALSLVPTARTRPSRLCGDALTRYQHLPPGTR